MSAGLKDLRVWQEAVALAADVVRAVRQGNRKETSTIGDALMLTSLSLAAHIAEGYGRYTAPEQRQVYRAARRDLLRLETQIAIAQQADLLSTVHLAQISQRAQLVARLLGGYLVYLDRQLAEPAAPAAPAAHAAPSRDSARVPE
jgi:four helix bundle protein